MVVVFQLATPMTISGLIALQFGFNPMKMMAVAGAAFVGFGVVLEWLNLRLILGKQELM